MTVQGKMNTTKTAELVETVVSTDDVASPFPISQLPPEIRHQIYASYFASLPAIEITSSNSASLKHYLATPLALASPYFSADIPADQAFYAHSSFEFGSSGQAMKEFAVLHPRVRKINAVFGKEKGLEARNRDWLYLMNGFERLEEVTFVKKNADGLANWWYCVQEAAREMWCSKGQKGKMPVLFLKEIGEKGVVDMYKLKLN